MPWALLALLLVAVLRPPTVLAWWAWAAWFVVCVGLIVAAAAVTIARGAS